jgi:hypothetical protein
MLASTLHMPGADTAILYQLPEAMELVVVYTLCAPAGERSRQLIAKNSQFLLIQSVTR